MKSSEVKVGMIVILTKIFHTNKYYGSNPMMEELVGRRFIITKIDIYTEPMSVRLDDNTYIWHPGDLLGINNINKIKKEITKFDIENLNL